MSFGMKLGGLWKPKQAGAKAAASGAFSLPCVVSLDPKMGHRFVITARTKAKANEPDFDLWLFADDGQDRPAAGELGPATTLGTTEDQPPADDVSF